MFMAAIRVMAERSIAAPAEEVYRYIADYRTHHPRFLPPAFSAFQVDQGGVGEGTIVRFRVRAGGRTRAVHQRVSEATPGRGVVGAGAGRERAAVCTIMTDSTPLMQWLAKPAALSVRIRSFVRGCSPDPSPFL